MLPLSTPVSSLAIVVYIQAAKQVYTPDICPRTCLGRWGVLPKIEWVAPSTIWQWVYIFFQCGHPQLCNRQTILVALESTGPYQRNDASLIFMRCVVLEIRLFLIKESDIKITKLKKYLPYTKGMCLVSSPKQYLLADWIQSETKEFQIHRLLLTMTSTLILLEFLFSFSVLLLHILRLQSLMEFFSVCFHSTFGS